jgi:hypothetical protein
VVQRFFATIIALCCAADRGKLCVPHAQPHPIGPLAAAMTDSISRRRLLTQILQLSIGGALVTSAHAADTECVDLKAMSSSEVSARNSLHWTAMSKQAGKSCAMCNFFSATAGGCGSCVILGGATYATGYCDSWTAKDS